jgi:hypothetical protein
MLLFIGRSQKTKTRTQSSERGVVATGKLGHLLGRLLIERHVRLLGGPQAMEQNGQLACYRNDGLALGLPAPSGS